jgi:hypothetical protein
MSAIQHEYYIRQPGDTEARGPFTLAQLSSLAGDGGFDARTLYFDADGEQWLPVTGSAELGILLRNTPGATTRARRGDTDSVRLARAAPLAAGVARVLLFASAAVLLLLAFVIMGRGGGVRALFLQPFFWLGVVDVFLGAFAAFFTARLALVVRLRAAAGLGLLGVFFWLVAAVPALVLAVIASACLWLATVFEGRRALFVDAIAGLAALAGFAYCVL